MYLSFDLHFSSGRFKQEPPPQIRTDTNTTCAPFASFNLPSRHLIETASATQNHPFPSLTHEAQSSAADAVFSWQSWPRLLPSQRRSQITTGGVKRLHNLPRRRQIALLHAIHSTITSNRDENRHPTIRAGALQQTVARKEIPAPLERTRNAGARARDLGHISR